MCGASLPDWTHARCAAWVAANVFATTIWYLTTRDTEARRISITTSKGHGLRLRASALKIQSQATAQSLRTTIAYRHEPWTEKSSYSPSYLSRHILRVLIG